ncbi:MAG: glycosyltransferase family 2 protein [Gammaproteobacteria bacterium]
MKSKVSIILPAKNEAASLADILPRLKSRYPEHEIIVVNDGSDDETVEICRTNQVSVVSHQYSKGNGAAIKSGARAASGDILVFMDADGQHATDDIDHLIAGLEAGYDMVVAARHNSDQASLGRGAANFFYNKFASLVTGHRISDLTSGFRAVKADKFRQFLYLLPNGFSYPSTITMVFFRVGYSVKYVPVRVSQRKGKSHIKPLKDGVRFLLIIFRISTLYSPLKIFFPLSFLFFLAGCSHYVYNYIMYEKFTNMSAMLLIVAVLVFLIGLVSEQITTLLYSREQ